MPTLGPSPGDDITPEDLKPAEPKSSKMPRWLQRLFKSEVKPAVITDKGGTSRPGIEWRKRF